MESSEFRMDIVTEPPGVELNASKKSVCIRFLLQSSTNFVRPNDSKEFFVE